MDSKMAAAIKAFQEQVAKRSFDSITDQQKRTVFDTPAKGPTWLSRVTFPAPSDESKVLQVLQEVVKSMGDRNVAITEPWPSLRAVSGEWVAYRDLSKDPLSGTALSEEQNYHALTKSVCNPITILYAHGGAFYFGSPAATRPAMIALANLTGGRCFGVQYRLSPQHAFPAALFDVFQAYLSLLYPPPGAYHGPVRPENIVFGGDSSGGNLVLAVLQVIRHLRSRQASQWPKIRFNGKDVEVPYPAGCAVMGLLGDNTHCLPSYTANATFDVLTDPQPLLQGSFPSCPVWPTDPPRGDVYCEISAMCHPLISLVTATEWAELPPLWFATGQEQMRDDSAMVAQLAARQGVAVQWTEYLGMPHLFAFKFPGFPQSMHAFHSWSSFVKDCVFERENVESWALRVRAEDMEEGRLNVKSLLNIDGEELERLMRARQKERRIWIGTKAAKSLL